ncbi:MAG: hypothetical protein ABSE42_21700 [Bryobacteraceae bacterium]
MKTASIDQRGEINAYLKTNPDPCPELDCAKHLHRIADTFLRAQQQRHTADYDNSTTWTRTDVTTLIDLVDNAFRSWRQIRDEATAQAYLITLLGKPRGT